MDVVLFRAKLTALMGEAIKQSHSMRSCERKAKDACENQRSWFRLATALKRRHFSFLLGAESEWDTAREGRGDEDCVTC